MRRWLPRPGSEDSSKRKIPIVVSMFYHRMIQVDTASHDPQHAPPDAGLRAGRAQEAARAPGIIDGTESSRRPAPGAKQGYRHSQERRSETTTGASRSIPMRRLLMVKQLHPGRYLRQRERADDPRISTIRKRWPWMKDLFADGAYDRRRLMDAAASRFRHRGGRVASTRSPASRCCRGDGWSNETFGGPAAGVGGRILDVEEAKAALAASATPPAGEAP